MQILTILVYCLIAFVVAVIAFLNVEMVTINYYFDKKTIALPVLAIGLLILGIFVGFCIHLMNVIKLKMENRSLKKKLRLTEEELSKLRVLSVEGSI